MKAKTVKSLKKRIKVTGTGKYLRLKGGKSHLLSSKSRKRKRLLSRPILANKPMAKKIKRLLPYG